MITPRWIEMIGHVHINKLQAPMYFNDVNLHYRICRQLCSVAYVVLNYITDFVDS